MPDPLSSVFTPQFGLRHRPMGLPCSQYCIGCRRWDSRPLFTWPLGRVREEERMEGAGLLFRLMRSLPSLYGLNDRATIPDERSSVKAYTRP